MRFIKKYIETGSPTLAAREARPDKEEGGSNMSLVGNAMLRANSTISGALKQIMEKERLTIFTMAHALSEEIFDKPNKTPQERSIRLKAIEMACKIGDIFAESKIDESLPIKIVYHEEETVPEDTQIKIIEEEVDDTRPDSLDSTAAPTEDSKLQEEIHISS